MSDLATGQAVAEPDAGPAPPVGPARPSSTAQLVALFRAGEHNRPAEQRIFSDPFASLFVTEPRLAFMLRHPRLLRLAGRLQERRRPGIVGVALLRCRYAEDALDQAMREGVSQLVLIGAGYDSTAARMPPGNGLRVYELDQPATQAQKRTILQEHAPDALERATLVPCDLRQEKLSSALSRTDFDPQRPAFFNWLGVTMFLPQEAVEAVLRDVASVAAPGSRLVLDYMEAAVIDGSTSSASARRASADVQRRGEAFRFGLRHGQAAEWLPGLGFEVREQSVAADLLRRYFPDGAHREAADFMGLVLAERPQDPARPSA